MKRRHAIRAAYDRWSSTYDSQQNPTRDLDAVVLRRLVPPLQEKIVIEAGCGTGKNLLWLAARCRHLLGLDFSAGMLQAAQAKSLADQVALVRCDITQPWPLKAAVADLVLFSLVLEHVESLVPPLSQAARVLAPGGLLLISEFHPERIVSGEGAEIADAGGDNPRFIGSYLHTLEEYQAVAASLGLVLESTADWRPEAPEDAADDVNSGLPLILSLRLRNDAGQ